MNESGRWTSDSPRPLTVWALVVIYAVVGLAIGLDQNDMNPTNKAVMMWWGLGSSALMVGSLWLRSRSPHVAAAALVLGCAPFASAVLWDALF